MSRFQFTVPACDPGSVLRLTAPDGAVLNVPLPADKRPGDTMTLAKMDDGSWGIVVEVPAPVAAQTAWKSAEAMARECAAPGTTRVRLDTSKGPIFIQVVPGWSPRGAERFLGLVGDGFYRDVPIYRAIAGGLLQFGALQAADPRCSRYEPLPDDPLAGVPYAEGVVAFAAAGPGTRKHTVCIMKADFRTQLGKGAVGTTSTETPFGMVCPESMATMHSITCLGDIPQCGGSGPDPQLISERGNEYIRSQFPTCDFVTGAATVS